MAELLTFPTDSTNVASLPDMDARRQALDIHRSFIVEAPAGSGKTGLLVQRYLKLLADESVTSPTQVLAITFTNKATAELRDRVLKQLEAARSEVDQSQPSEFALETLALARAVLAREGQPGWSLLDNPRLLNLRTIDAVCAEIARSLPILSGSGGRLTPVEDDKPLLHEAARRTLLLLGSGDAAFDDALRDLLLHRDGDLAECESLLAKMLALRDQWGRLIPLDQSVLDDAWLDANVLPRLELALNTAICGTLKHVERTFPPHLLAELTAIALDLSQCDGLDGNPSPLAPCAGLHQPPTAQAPHLEHWRALLHLLLTQQNSWRKDTGITGKNLKLIYDRKRPHHARLVALINQLSGHDDLLEALCNLRSLPPSIYPQEQWEIAKSLFRVLRRALAELRLVFASRGECDFVEIGLLARHALKQDSGADDLASAVGARLQHLLVDEMQDTSTSQYELIEHLTASWDGYSQTLFLVGDPRQSIYLFRQARVERFIATMQQRQLGDLPLTLLRLTANFRSQRTLVDQFNDDFALIFSGLRPNSSGNNLGYSPVQATLPASIISRARIWHAHPLPVANALETRAQIRQRQARHDADEILRIAQARLVLPLPPGRTAPWKIAVLVRSRNHLNELITALRRQNCPIPFKTVDIENLNERQEILDLTALTRALLHPADRVAGLALLRAPWCGLSMADLHTLVGGDDASLRCLSIPRLMAERGHLLSDESCQRMTRVWSVLQAASARRTGLTTVQLVERAWLSLGGDAWLTASQLENAHRFFQLLDALETSHARIDTALLSARLGSVYAEPATIADDVGYIELLTIHKAKGLEWDLVIVPALERIPAINQTHLLSWAEVDSSHDGAAHVMLAPIPGRGEPSHALNHWLNSIQSSRETAEVQRLFYVACTRAKDELHLFAAPQITGAGTLNPPSKSLLKAAWPAAKEHFAAVSAPAIDNSDSCHEADADLKESPAVDIAANAPAISPTLHRLPITFDPSARFAAARAQQLPYGDAERETEPAARPLFTRPQGSVAARSFGNVLHACLDLLARKIQDGHTASALLAELPAWKLRISALLRADGLQQTAVERLAREARRALDRVLRDPDGLWLLANHAGAASEFAITAASDGQQGHETAIRADRIFFAGPEPQAPGDDFLWIVDYKTTNPGSSDLNDFLAAQNAEYRPQLEAYARVLSPLHARSFQQTRVALYFPAMPHLLWWQPTLED